MSSARLRSGSGNALKLKLSLGALGVVFGDIGTSPLYTMQECLAHLPASERVEGVIGVLSLILWALMFEVSFKYLMFVTRADNRGEGGIFALLALAHKSTRPTPPGGAKARRGLGAATVLILLGAALLYGDGVITPAISVLGAAEGLTSFSTELEQYVVPIAVVIIAGLFLVQSKGTESIGRVFGPVILVWFTVLGVLGAIHLFDDPQVFRAINPLHGWRLLATHPGQAVAIVGSIVLAITGAEALYADMGHFGRPAIARAWWAVVMPGLVLCYFGQGAYVLGHPLDRTNPF